MILEALPNLNGSMILNENKLVFYTQRVDYGFKGTFPNVYYMKIETTE